MSCRFCGLPCGGAHIALEQLRAHMFPKIFNPAFARERKARGLASVIASLELRGYETDAIAKLLQFAEAVDGKKTIARAQELKADPFIISAAQRMADDGFKLGNWAKDGSRKELLN